MGQDQQSPWKGSLSGLVAWHRCKEESKSCVQRGHSHPEGICAASQSSTARQSRGYMASGQEALVWALLPEAECHIWGLAWQPGGSWHHLDHKKPQTNPKLAFAAFLPPVPSSG